MSGQPKFYFDSDGVHYCHYDCPHFDWRGREEDPPAFCIYLGKNLYGEVPMVAICPESGNHAVKERTCKCGWDWAKKENQ